MPVRHARSETRGRPPFGRRGGIGKNGSTRSHNGSGSSAAAIRVHATLPTRIRLRRFCYTLLRTGSIPATSFDRFTAIVKRVQDGETADVIVIPQQGIDGFVKSGMAVAGNVTVIARGGIGVVVRKGAPKPDISSSEALKRTLLAARSIAYPNPELGGPTGLHFAKMLDRLGIGNEMKPKAVFPKTPGGAEVGGLVASGQAEIGVHQIQELMPVAGIEIVGPLPGDLQNITVFSAAIMAGAKDTKASKALIDFLRTPEAAAVIKAKGMEPR